MSPALVFDLDDTLYPEAAYNLSGFAAVGRHVQARCGFQGFGERCAGLFRLGRRGDIFDRALAAAGLAVAVPELVAVYREHAPEIALFDDARAVLAALRGRRLGLLTDGFAAVQRRKVAALGIAGDFAALVYSDDEGREAWKPSPRPYQRMMRELGGDAFVYIGDNPAKDFVAARALGWGTVRVARPGAVHPAGAVPPGYDADLVVDSLLQVPWTAL